MRLVAAVILVFCSPAVWAGGVEFIWGLGTHVGHSAYSANHAVKALRELGVTSFRDDVSWGRLERVRGRFEFSAAPAVEIEQFLAVPELSGRGILILGYGNELYGGGQPLDSAYRAAYADYVGRVADRYGQRVYGFEIWNEWNIGLGSKPPRIRHGSPSGYVELVKAAAPRIRSSVPGAKVICGALADKDLAWVAAVVELGVLAQCDAFSVHPYNFSEGWRAKPHYMALWLDELDLLIRKKVGKSFPVLVTELGWPNHSGAQGVSASVSSDYWVQSALYTLARPFVSGLWWYELRDSGTLGEEREHNFGVLDNSWGYKPIAHAMKSLLPLLRKVDRSTVKASSSGGVLAWHADLNDGQRLSAYWTIDGSSRVYRVENSASLMVFGAAGKADGQPAGSFRLDGSPLVFLHR